MERKYIDERKQEDEMYEEEIDGTGVVGRVVLTIGRNSIRSRFFGWSRS